MFLQSLTDSSGSACLSHSTELRHPLHVLAPPPTRPPPDPPFGPLRPAGLDDCPPLPSLLFFPVCIVVTVQLYLSHKRTESSGGGGGGVPAAPAATATLAATRQQALAASRAAKARKGTGSAKTPSFSLQLRKSGSLSSYCSLDTPSYRSPVKSPSQYFQICY